MNDTITPDFKRLNAKGEQQDVLDASIDHFFSETAFQTEQESIQPENVEIAKQAFIELCDSLGWIGVKQAFEELLEEKSGEKEFRKFGEVPNWYHELRQIVPVLSRLKSGLLDINALEKYGGLEIYLIAKLRHDSYEDFKKTPAMLYAKLEEKLHKQHDLGEINDTQLLDECIKASTASKIIELVSRKTTRINIDENDNFYDEEINLFPNNLNEHYDKMLQHVFAYILKLEDSIEGVSTRFDIEQFLPSNEDQPDTKKLPFTTDDHIAFARFKRSLYGTMGADREALEKWPEFSKTLHSLDATLGITLVILDAVNEHYVEDSQFNATHAKPIQVDRYIDCAMDSYKFVPDGFNPLMIMIERMENIARAMLDSDQFDKGIYDAEQYKMAEILENTIYPSLIPIIGDRRGTLLEKMAGTNNYTDDNDFQVT